MGTGDILPGVTLRWTGIPSRGSSIHSVASYYRNWVKLWPKGLPGSCAALPSLPYLKLKVVFHAM